MRGVSRHRLASAFGLLALVTGGCGASQQSAPSTRAPAASGDTAHIHGLGVSPSGELLIATHAGLLRQGDGSEAPRPLGPRHDLMGFTTTGSGRYLASGHPDPRETGMPAQLGIVQSRDRGKTWLPYALFGQFDFHVLEASGRRVYAVDAQSGTVMVGQDARRWSRRPLPDSVFSLAIDPEAPDRLVVATGSGLYRSDQAAASWRPVRSELTGLLAWPAPRSLYLVDVSGMIRVSDDGGRSWDTVGSISGRPTAFEATKRALYVAFEDGTVSASTDGGASWKAVKRRP